MHDPDIIEIGIVAKPVDQVRQVIYPVRTEDKQKMLLDLLKEEDIDSGIIFMRTKVRTDRLGKMLNKAGYRAAVIHGDLNQRQRQRSLDGFRNGSSDILVATDVAARGLDVDGITHVINYDIPMNPDDYVHRIGRTARAEKDGDAFTFVCPSEHKALANIEKTIGYNLPRKEYDGAPTVLSTWRPPGSPGPAGPGQQQVRSRGGVRRMGRSVGRRRR
jgi:ATP-dependent RNA helicase RhlE